MVDSLHHLLHNGSWQPGRTPEALNRSPRPSANQGAKLQVSVPRTFDMPSLRKFPPPPRVEDEFVSLAREYHTGPAPPITYDDEPKFRGEVEQQPILLPVHKYNPERRFVLVPKTSSSSDDESVASSRGPRTPTEKTDNDANNPCLKFTLPRLEQDGKAPIEETTSPANECNIKRRRSRADLTPIDTKTEPSQGPPSSHQKTTRASTRIEQDPVDYFGRQEQNRPQEETVMSPSIIKHSTKGRERAYYDYSGGGGATTESRSANLDNRSGPNRRVPSRTESATLTPGAAAHRRSNSAVEVPQISRRLSQKRSSRDETTSTRSSKKSSSPPAMERRNSSSTRDRGEKLGRRNSTYSKRADSPDRGDEHVVDDYAKERRMRERRMSGLSQESKPRSLAPEGPRPSGSSRSKPQAVSSQPPRLVQSNSYELESPTKAKSSTFPINKERRKYEERASSSLSSGSESPRSRSTIREEERPRGPRPATRPVLGSPTVSATPLIPAAVGLAAAAALADRRKTNVAPPPPPPPAVRRESQESSSSIPHWQPAPFDPVQNLMATDHPVQSYRRYSEDVSQQGNTDRLPACPRQIPQAGHLDWMTLPRCDNFNVCPTCYSTIFQDSDVFRSQLVPAPFRSTTKEIACDMGSSHWYRIAWFMTKKQNYPDLRLLKGITQVAAKMRPCRGSVETTRVWHSVPNPKTGRPIGGFEVCPNCVKSVEILFPNLVSVFQPLNSQGEPSKGICAMHFAPDRPRFLAYFDVLESVSDRALSAKLVPDIDNMAKQLEQLSRVRECVRDNPRSHVEWHSMQALDDFTVCPQCFDEVVDPLLGESHIARNFYQKPSRFQLASCQLYSPRMRKIFAKACKMEDMDFLTSKVRERQLMDDRIHDKIKELRKKADDDDNDMYANEIMMLREEWEKWE